MLPLPEAMGWGLLSSAMAAPFASWTRAQQSSTKTLPVCLSLLVQPQLCLPLWDLSLSQEQPPWGITTAPGPDQAALTLLSLPLLCFVPWQGSSTQSCSQGALHPSSAVKGKEGAWEDTL